MKSQIAQKGFVPGTSRGPRSARTLLLQMAADLERQREIGQRIKALREELGLTQPVLADKVGVTLRAAQAWEAGGGIGYENRKRLAEELGVSEEFLLFGEPGRQGPSTQLDRIEAKLDAVLVLLREEQDVAANEAADAIGEHFEAGAGGAASPTAGGSKPQSGEKPGARRKAPARGKRRTA